MFRDRDLLARLPAALLAPSVGYAATRLATRLLGGGRLRWIENVVQREAERILKDPALAQQTGERFAAEIACDDLDALTANLWPERVRLATTAVEGADTLPREGPLVITSFHLSGGFRVFDVLRARGLRPTFLMAPVRPVATRYLAVMERLRRVHLSRTLALPFVFTGKGARESLASHLESGGVVVALLDVAPSTLELRDFARATLFGHELTLPVGLLRLAARLDVPVVPYAGRLDEGGRVIRFHAPLRGRDPEAMLAQVLAVFEQIIRDQPWSWQSWLELDSLLRVEMRIPTAGESC